MKSLRLGQYPNEKTSILKQSLGAAHVKFLQGFPSKTRLSCVHKRLSMWYKLLLVEHAAQSPLSSSQQPILFIPNTAALSMLSHAISFEFILLLSNSPANSLSRPHNTHYRQRSTLAISIAQHSLSTALNTRYQQRSTLSINALNTRYQQRSTLAINSAQHSLSTYYHHSVQLAINSVQRSTAGQTRNVLSTRATDQIAKANSLSNTYEQLSCKCCHSQQTNDAPLAINTDESLKFNSQFNT